MNRRFEKVEEIDVFTKARVDRLSKDAQVPLSRDPEHRQVLEMIEELDEVELDNFEMSNLRLTTLRLVFI